MSFAVVPAAGAVEEAVVVGRRAEARVGVMGLTGGRGGEELRREEVDVTVVAVVVVVVVVPVVDVDGGGGV